MNFRRGPFLCTALYRTLCKWATSVAHLTNFSFEFFYKIFTEDASLPLLYHGAKKSKMTKNSNQGGPALIFMYLVIYFIYWVQPPVIAGWIVMCSGGGAIHSLPTWGLGFLVCLVHQKTRGLSEERYLKEREKHEITYYRTEKVTKRPEVRCYRRWKYPLTRSD